MLPELYMTVHCLDSDRVSSGDYQPACESTEQWGDSPGISAKLYDFGHAVSDFWYLVYLFKFTEIVSNSNPR